MKKKKGFNWKILLKVAIGLLLFFIGILVGIQMGTYAVIDHVAYGLAGSTFIVNLNETRLIEEMNKTIFPQMKEEIDKIFGDEMTK